MRDWLGDEADDLFAAMDKREIGLRLNPRRGDTTALRARLSQAGWETQPVPWCPAGAWMPEDKIENAPGKHPYHTAGVYYLQDPSAMAAGVILDPRPGEWVLDIAAAPGGKATHIAARMEQRGVLVANDVSRGRASVLAKNIERMGVTNALITNETPPRLADRWAGLFDAVLVDAPCSGESTFARDDQAARQWNLDEVRSYAYHQGQILAQSARLVRPGGRLLYGTCTFSPEENEGVIAAFLAEHEDFELQDLPALPGLQPGRPEWIDAPGMLAARDDSGRTCAGSRPLLRAVASHRRADAGAAGALDGDAGAGARAAPLSRGRRRRAARRSAGRRAVPRDAARSSLHHADGARSVGGPARAPARMVGRVAAPSSGERGSRAGDGHPPGGGARHVRPRAR